jgi:hypothetical protein
VSLRGFATWLQELLDCSGSVDFCDLSAAFGLIGRRVFSRAPVATMPAQLTVKEQLVIERTVRNDQGTQEATQEGDPGKFRRRPRRRPRTLHRSRPGPPPTRRLPGAPGVPPGPPGGDPGRRPRMRPRKAQAAPRMRPRRLPEAPGGDPRRRPRIFSLEAPRRRLRPPPHQAPKRPGDATQGGFGPLLTIEYCIVFRRRVDCRLGHSVPQGHGRAGTHGRRPPKARPPPPARPAQGRVSQTAIYPPTEHNTVLNGRFERI